MVPGGPPPTMTRSASGSRRQRTCGGLREARQIGPCLGEGGGGAVENGLAGEGGAGDGVHRHGLLRHDGGGECAQCRGR